jgi:DNA-binding winged helix-turn-helix (wHTH) protein/predicted ATPase
MRYTFGTYSLDTERQELYRKGSPVPLQRKMYRVLLYLLEHRERLVSKNELFEHAWADTYVGDAALTQCIAALRKVLGDHRQAQGVIRTYHGRGYRFVSPVHEDAPPTPSEPLTAPLTATRPEPAATPSTPSPWPGGAPAPAAAERRLLTVLCCTLSDVQALVAQSDPEALYDLTQRWRSACQACFARFDGHVAQQTAEGFVVYFGYPLAHEDDARRAVHTGLALLETLDAPTSALSTLGLSIKVGIHTGVVVIESTADPAAPAVLAVGATPRIAAQLCAVVRAPGVAISGPTARLVDGYFTCKPLDPHMVPGRSEALPVHEVCGVSGLQSRVDVEEVSGLTPFVSREAELALLRDRWGQVQEGLGQILLVRGEAGIGKSRLAYAWREEIAGTPHVWLECRCSPYHHHTPFHPLVELLRRTLTWDGGTSEAEQLARLDELVRTAGVDPGEAVPLLARLLSLRDPAQSERASSLTPAQQRQRTLEALVRLVLAQTSTHPVAFLLEDVDWADPSTLELLDLLAAQAPTAGVMVLLTCRPMFVWPSEHRASVTPIALTRLSASHIARMIAQVAGGKPLPADVMDQLVARADGVPLYAEELTRLVLESGQLRETATRYEVRDPLARLTVPSTLQGSLMARLDRLGEAKEVAQWAAVLGREFRHDVLAAVMAPAGERWPVSVRRLLSADVLQQRGVGAQAVYRFRHALLQEAAYASILQRPRQEMHARVAEVMATQFAELVAQQPELLAHHYTEAGHRERAVQCWHRAGRLALARSAYAEAVSHLGHGLTLLAPLRETSADLDHLRQEVAMHLALGPALVATRGFDAPEVEHTYTRARALCQGLDDSRDLFAVLGGLWRCYLGRQDLRPVRALADEIHRLAEAADDRALLVEAYRVQGMSLLFLGELAPARSFLERCAALYDPAQHQDDVLRYGGATAGVSALACLSVVLWLLGHPDGAQQRGGEAIALAETIDHPFSLAFALSFAMSLAARLREPQAVRALADRLEDVASEHQFPYWLASARLQHSWVLAAEGRASEGIAQLEQAWAITASHRRRYHHVIAAAAYGLAGQPAAGLAILDAILPMVESTLAPYWAAEMYRLMGDLLVQRRPGDARRATTAWRRALAIARRQQARGLELPAALSLARLWQARGQGKAARALLAPIYQAFTEGFDTRDLQEARQLLRQ